MRSNLFASLFIAATTVFPIGTQAQQVLTTELNVAPGSTGRVWGWARFGTDCNQTGLVDYSWPRSPRQGVLQARQESIPIRQVSSADRQHCVGRYVNGAAVYLRADDHAQGSETFSFYMDRGQSYERRVDVTVHYRN